MQGQQPAQGSTEGGVAAPPASRGSATLGLVNARAAHGPSGIQSQAASVWPWQACHDGRNLCLSACAHTHQSVPTRVTLCPHVSICAHTHQSESTHVQLPTAGRTHTPAHPKTCSVLHIPVPHPPPPTPPHPACHSPHALLERKPSHQPRQLLHQHLRGRPSLLLNLGPHILNALGISLGKAILDCKVGKAGGEQVGWIEGRAFIGQVCDEGKGCTGTQGMMARRY